MRATDVLKRKAGTNVLAIYRDKVRKWKRSGEEYWGCCPFHSETTPSFKVDHRKGEWLYLCHGCHKGGDIISFIEQTRNVPFAEAVAVLAKLAGADGEWFDKSHRVEGALKQQAPDKAPKIEPLDTAAKMEDALQANQDALRWLQEQRGITPETAKQLHIGYVQTCPYSGEKDQDIRSAGWITFPRIQDGKVAAIKYRSIARKAFAQMPGMNARALFNVGTINPFEPVFVTEGEFDTAIFEQAGFRAVSLPNASTDIGPAGRNDLKGADSIYLAGDNDGSVGSARMEKLAVELGARTHVILWPGAKDANEFFLNVCKGDIAEFQTRVGVLQSEARGRPAKNVVSLVDRLRAGEDDIDPANDPSRLHFPKLLPGVDHMNYTPAGSVVILYSTYTGTGKTILKTQILLEEAMRGHVVVDFSPEVTGKQYDALVTSQLVGPTRPDVGLPRNQKITRKDMLEAADMLTKDGAVSYYVCHQIPATGSKETLEFIEHVIQVTGCTRFALDTFHKVVATENGENVTTAEGRFAKDLEKLAIKYNMIFLLICQSNAEAGSIDNLKRNEHGVLRGNREVPDAASSIYLLHRNKLPNKNGEIQDSVLELQGEIFLKKDRYKGPSKPQVRVALNESCSLFYQPAPQERQREPEYDDLRPTDTPGRPPAGRMTTMNTRRQPNLNWVKSLDASGTYRRAAPQARIRL